MKLWWQLILIRSQIIMKLFMWSKHEIVDFLREPYSTSTRKVKQLVKPSFKLSWKPLIFQQNIYRRKIHQECYRNWPNLLFHENSRFPPSFKFWSVSAIQKWKKMHSAWILRPKKHFSCNPHSSCRASWMRLKNFIYQQYCYQLYYSYFFCCFVEIKKYLYPFKVFCTLRTFLLKTLDDSFVLREGDHHVILEDFDVNFFNYLNPCLNIIVLK
jgi:hypothetical protein